MTQPAPVIAPAPPKLVQPPPAPKVVSLAQAQPAAVANNSPAPCRRRTRPAPIIPSPPPTAQPPPPSISATVACPECLPRTTAWVPRPPLSTSAPASHQPEHGMATDNCPAVQGVKLGVAGGTGPSTRPATSLAPSTSARSSPRDAQASCSSRRLRYSPDPRSSSSPRPEYTAEATRLHIEGVVSVTIHVSSSGAVQVIGVTSDLGHGLGESAIRAVQATRFQPATRRLRASHRLGWCRQCSLSVSWLRFPCYHYPVTFF